MGDGDCGIQIITNSGTFEHLPLLDIEKLDMNTEWAFKTANKFVKLGKKLTRGLGSGAVVKIGKQAAEEDRSSIVDAIEGGNLLIVVAGLGGGTGSGASPVIAETAKDLGVPTIAFVTLPFDFEGKIRNKNAQYGLEVLRGVVDVLFVLSDEKFLTHNLERKQRPVIALFKEIDEILQKNILKVLELFDFEISKGKSVQEIFEMFECDKAPYIELLKTKQN